MFATLPSRTTPYTLQPTQLEKERAFSLALYASQHPNADSYALNLVMHHVQGNRPLAAYFAASTALNGAIRTRRNTQKLFMSIALRLEDQLQKISQK